MRKQITLKHDNYSICPECDGELLYQDNWDRLADRYGDIMPSFDLALKRLHKEKEPKYICESCKLEILVK